MVDRGDAREVRIRGVTRERAFPLTHVGSKDQAGVMQFASLARRCVFLRSEHPELQAVNAPVWLVPAILLVRRVQFRPVPLEMVSDGVEFVPLLDCNASVAVPAVVRAID